MEYWGNLTGLDFLKDLKWLWNIGETLQVWVF